VGQVDVPVQVVPRHVLDLRRSLMLTNPSGALNPDGLVEVELEVLEVDLEVLLETKSETMLVIDFVLLLKVDVELVVAAFDAELVVFLVLLLVVFELPSPCIRLELRVSAVAVCVFDAPISRNFFRDRVVGLHNSFATSVA